VLAVEIVILIIWTAVDRPKAVLHKMVDNTYMLQCRTEHVTFWVIFIVIKGIWLIFGAVLSALTRNVTEEYNQSKGIIYNYSIANIGSPLSTGVGKHS